MVIKDLTKTKIFFLGVRRQRGGALAGCRRSVNENPELRQQVNDMSLVEQPKLEGPAINNSDTLIF